MILSRKACYIVDGGVWHSSVLDFKITPENCFFACGLRATVACCVILKTLQFLFHTLNSLRKHTPICFPSLTSQPLMLSEKLVKQAVKFVLFMMHTCLSARSTKCCTVSCQPWDLLRMDSLTDTMTGSCQAWSIELAQSICPWLTEGELWWHTERANY